MVVSWCTVWKGTPQDCIDHVQGAHDVPWDVKSASMEQSVLPWTVQHQVWLDSLKASFRNFDGRSYVQQYQFFAGSPLSDTQARAPASCLQKGLYGSSVSIVVTGGGPVSG